MKPVSISLRGREKEAAFKANLRNRQGVNGQVVHYKTKVREAVKSLYISDSLNFFLNVLICLRMMIFLLPSMLPEMSAVSEQPNITFITSLGNLHCNISTEAIWHKLSPSSREKWKRRSGLL